MRRTAIAQIRHPYVRIFGTIKAYQGKRTIQAHSVRLVSNPNELTHHMLEVVHVHCLLNGTPSGGGGGVKQENYAANGVGFGGGMPAARGASLNNDGGSSKSSGGNSLHAAILSYIRERSDAEDSGVNSSEMVKDLSISLGSANVSAKTINEGLQYLSGEGLIYSTIDDFTWKYAA